MSQPWHKRKIESRQAYAAFCAYYQLPVQERSIDAAYRRATNRQETSIHAPGTWTGWSSKHEWVSRASLHDEHLAELDRQQWEERRRRLRERDWEQADALRRVVDEAIPHANQFIRRQTTTIRGQDGAPDQIVVTLAFDITALSRVLTDASKLQRLATDEPTENIQLTGAALDAYIAAQLARLANGGEAGVGGASQPDEAETKRAAGADDASL